MFFLNICLGDDYKHFSTVFLFISVYGNKYGKKSNWFEYVQTKRILTCVLYVYTKLSVIKLGIILTNIFISTATEIFFRCLG